MRGQIIVRVVLIFLVVCEKVALRGIAHGKGQKQAEPVDLGRGPRDGTYFIFVTTRSDILIS